MIGSACHWQDILEEGLDSDHACPDPIGVAPPVVLEATNAKALDFVTIEQLESKALTERNEL